MFMASTVTIKRNSLNNDALLSLVRTGSIISKVSHSFFSQFGLTEAQYNALVILRDEPCGLQQSEIGKKMVSTRASITSLIDRLELKKYVVRNVVESDRRIYHVCITNEGRKRLGSVEESYFAKVNSIMGGLTEKELQELLCIMQKLQGHIGHDFTNY